MTEDEAHEAMGAMLHTMSQPYRKMHDSRDDYVELSRRARLYQAQAHDRTELLRQAYEWIYAQELANPTALELRDHCRLIMRLQDALGLEG
jgi:hypothetical protein